MNGRPQNENPTNGKQKKTPRVRHIDVEHEGRRYRVRAVKRGAPLRDDYDMTGGFEMLLVVPFAMAYFWWLDRREASKVGILRERVVPKAKPFRGTVIHKEVLDLGVDPGPRIRELVEAVKRGDYGGG
ncbi:hypothetical protein [Ornithinimicrobium sp. Y1694]|uniref:hypothetical protein n=1 Tax=Ornithinimicrobium sp. Y1694 TaxID=3418590 RepID=UPI003CF62706